MGANVLKTWFIAHTRPYSLPAPSAWANKLGLVKK